MANAHQLCSADGSEQIILIPCTCGDCDGTTMIVEKRVGRKKRRRLELTLDGAALEMLQGILNEVKEYHECKAGKGWPSVELN